MPNSIHSAPTNTKRTHLSHAHSNAASPFMPLSSEQLLELRFRLLNRLQQSLDLEVILENFLDELKRHIPISGIGYNWAVSADSLQIGKQSLHACHYDLTMQNQNYGTLSVRSRRRFDESELRFIESVMDLLIFPLRNSLTHRRALEHALTDPLTSLHNRKAMDIALQREIERSRRHSSQAISLIMVDIDHFKEINDRFGHLAGDEIIRAVAHELNAAVRASDVCFRYGGEEFLVCLSCSNLALARLVAERIRTNICAHIKLMDSDEEVSVSCGVAHYDGEDDWTELVQRADSALYKAKQQGRNQVITALPETG